MIRDIIVSLAVISLLCMVKVSASQTPAIPYRVPASKFSTLKILPDTLNFRGYDSTFWIKNEYFCFSNTGTKDTSILFGKIYKDDCVLVFTLIAGITSKIILLNTYQATFNPELFPIDTIVVAQHTDTPEIKITQSFYIQNRWCGISYSCQSKDKRNNCCGNKPSWFQIVNFNFSQGRLYMVI